MENIIEVQWIGYDDIPNLNQHLRLGWKYLGVNEVSDMNPYTDEQKTIVIYSIGWDSTNGNVQYVIDKNNVPETLNEDDDF